MVVVDVDLREVLPGRSTAYGARTVARVLAGAWLVYAANHHDAVYAEWLGRLESIRAGSGGELKRLDHAASTQPEVLDFLKRGALPPTRKKRLEQFATTADSISKASELESLTAEIILPRNVLPLRVLEAALCKGALAAVRSWSVDTLDEKERIEVERKLLDGSRPLAAGEYAPDTPEAKRELTRIIDEIRGNAPPFDDPRQMALQLELSSTGLQGKWKKDCDEARELLDTERYDAAAEQIERISRDIGAHLEQAPDDEGALEWMARVHLLRAFRYLNCQERVRAADSSEVAAHKLATNEQVVMLKSGTMPDRLVEEPTVLL